MRLISKPWRELELHQIFIKFIYFLFFFYVFYLFLFLFTYILAFFLGHFLIKHEILITNFDRAELECIFSCFCLFLYFDFSFELKNYMQCVYKPSENNNYRKKQ